MGLCDLLQHTMIKSGTCIDLALLYKWAKFEQYVNKVKTMNDNMNDNNINLLECTVHKQSNPRKLCVLQMYQQKRTRKMCLTTQVS